MKSLIYANVKSTCPATKYVNRYEDFAFCGCFAENKIGHYSLVFVVFLFVVKKVSGLYGG